MSLHKDIDKLTRAGIISEETAENIRQFYQKEEEGKSQKRLNIAFAITGTVLVGLGIILIVAHKWQELSKAVKLLFAFLPLLAGQVLGGYVLLRKRDSIAWRESAATFLFFAIGACIAMVSYIYRLPDDLPGYLFTWSLLVLPLIYLLRSSMVSLLYLIFIMVYAFETAEIPSYPHSNYFYWPLLALALPHYFHLLRHEKTGNFTLYHNWILPITLGVALATLTDYYEEIMVVAYVSLFGAYYMIGNLPYFKDQKLIRNSYRIIGSVGTVMMLLFMSFDEFWNSLRSQEFLWKDTLSAPEFYASVIITIAALMLFVKRWKGRRMKMLHPVEAVFIVFVMLFILGLCTPAVVLFINLLVLAMGILIAREGAMSGSLGLLNYGLIIIMILALFRFFDTDISFVARGILFLLAGGGFLFGNYYMIKRKKSHE